MAKKKQPERPEFELAQGAWTRDNFETLKEKTKSDGMFLEVFVMEAVKGHHLEPRRLAEERKSYTEHQFDFLSQHPYLFGTIDFLDYDDDASSLDEEDDYGLTDEQLSSKYIRARDYVGFAITGTGSPFDTQERLFKRNYHFGLKKNQKYNPGIDINIFQKHAHQQEAIYAGCQNAKRQGGLLAIRFYFDKRRGELHSLGTNLRIQKMAYS